MIFYFWDTLWWLIGIPRQTVSHVLHKVRHSHYFDYFTSFDLPADIDNRKILRNYTDVN